jgi:adenylosuccinate lyase
MIDDRNFEEIFLRWDSGQSLINLHKIKGLRILLRSVEQKLEKFNQNPIANEELIFQEKVMLMATQKELQRLERRTICEELDTWEIA